MWSALTGLVKSLNDNQSVFGQFLTTMHTDNTEPEVSVGLHGTIKESPESESKSKYSRSYEWRAERHDKKISKLGVCAI